MTDGSEPPPPDNQNLPRWRKPGAWPRLLTKIGCWAMAAIMIATIIAVAVLLRLSDISPGEAVTALLIGVAIPMSSLTALSVFTSGRVASDELHDASASKTRGIVAGMRPKLTVIVENQAVILEGQRRMAARLDALEERKREGAEKDKIAKAYVEGVHNGAEADVLVLRPRS